MIAMDPDAAHAPMAMMMDFTRVMICVCFSRLTMNPARQQVDPLQAARIPYCLFSRFLSIHNLDTPAHVQ